jgi:branched-chain amino acid transport system substrate-binding protein
MKLLGMTKSIVTIRDDQYKTDVTKRNFEDFLTQGIVFISTTLLAAPGP